MDGKLVAVKAISPDCVRSFDGFKRVRLVVSPKYPLLMPISVWVLTEIVDQWDHVETTPASKRGPFPRVWLCRPSFLPCVPLDVQWEFV